MRPTYHHTKLNWYTQRCFLLFAGVALTATLIACGGDSPDVVPTAALDAADQNRFTQEMVRSKKSRDDSPGATAEELAELVYGNSAFAFDLYHAFTETSDGNLFYSPHSISLALAMTHVGARGETERQMADTVHFLLTQERLHPAFNELDLQLSSRAGRVEVEDEGRFQLSIANSVWGQEDYPFLDSYLDRLVESYGAGVMPVDFQGIPEKSRIAINDWVADRTEKRIKELIPPNVINSSTRLVLVSAIYFKARWLHTFANSLTGTGPFYLVDGREVETIMMTMAGAARLGYSNGEGYQAVELPYEGLEISMIILFPDAGTFREFEKSLDADEITGILEDFERENVEFTMPQFEFELGIELGDTLNAMGMQDAFDGAASDFSGVDGRSCIAGDAPCLFISDVFHTAFVAVDEEGTEAAAATTVTEKVVEGFDPITVSVDGPFIFFIRDNLTGTILFVGRVVDPRR